MLIEDNDKMLLKLIKMSFKNTILLLILFNLNYYFSSVLKIYIYIYILSVSFSDFFAITNWI